MPFGIKYRYNLRNQTALYRSRFARPARTIQTAFRRLQLRRKRVVRKYIKRRFYGRNPRYH